MPDSVDPFINLLPLDDEQKLVLSTTVRLVFAQRAVFEDAVRRLEKEYPAAAAAKRKRTPVDRLVAAMKDAVERTVADAPDSEVVAHSRQLVLLAVLASYRDCNNELAWLGEWAAWPWRSTGSPVGNFPRRKPGEPREPPFVAGRETVLFSRFRQGPDDTQPWIDELLSLLPQAIGVVKRTATAEPAPATPGHTDGGDPVSVAAAQRGAGDADDDFVPARWFTKHTDITSDNLRQEIAKKHPRIRVKKRAGEQNRYSKTDAKARWPHSWTRHASPKPTPQHAAKA